MSVAIKKLSGVTDVKVSLNEGIADVKLADGNKLTVEIVRDVIRKNGFTPKQATVTVAGKLIDQSGKPALSVPGPDVVYALEGDTSKLKAMSGKEVVITGEIPEASDKASARTLHIK